MIRLTWDEGWAGKTVHRGDYDRLDVPRPVTIHERDDETILYVEMDGVRFRITRRERAGFRR